MTDKPRLAEVVTLYETNASDVAAMLREAADNIEQGKCEPVRQITAIAELEDGSFGIYGWGATDTLRSIATLQIGLTMLTLQKVAKGEEE